jgi:hypothetical protein
MRANAGMKALEDFVLFHCTFGRGRQVLLRRLQIIFGGGTVTLPDAAAT